MEYPSNSHKSKAQTLTPAVTTPEKKVEKVTTGTVKTKKKSEARKLKDIFLAEDLNNIKTYIFNDVLVPAIKKAVKDIVTDGIEMLLYGESGRSGKRSTADRVSYGRCYNQDDRFARTSSSNRGYNYDDVIFDNRADAEEVLRRMDEMMATYGIVSVADFNELAGVPGQYTDNRYGWTSIRTAKVARVRDGYLIEMPKAMPID